ncbi:adenylyl-sulfate kinase [Membranicola marinus]|uniref:Adenylyl-sulfate kinase n=1 Tax=Membranihabitans marinus TaxID=1227546 RepID=A0A953HRH5_9BACT|nr:adenylyl-sulfate kinase [Membranihabitans marinus]MBY5956961.1 adenylyl-sulfate kinase [Membranihabitans marinus]
MHIFPIYDRTVSREAKEQLVRQQGQVLWFTGLSGSGKTTLALALEKKLTEEGHLVALLDGDNIRDRLCGDLTFTQEDRMENIRRISEVARILVHNGLVVLCSFVSPEASMRQLAADIIGPEDFHLVYVKASVDTCKNRDPKGLYEKAIQGEIENFTGISAPFEVPDKPQLVLDTESNEPDQNLEKLLNYTIKHIRP